MVAAKTPAFEKAIIDSRNLKAKPTNDELLKLYALYKQGSQETKFQDAVKPSAFDLKGKAKYNAWKELVEKDDLTPAKAQEAYVKFVGEMKTKHGVEAAA